MDRGYIDGAYDLVHSGHFNAIRQGSLAVHTLVVGPNADEDIMKFKGPTILTGQERAEIIRAVKWGDVVIPDTPYEVTEEILDTYNCQYYIHGDDIMWFQGINFNEYLINKGRFKEIRRTTGVSTTDLTGKILRLLDPDVEEEKQGPPAARFAKPPKQTFL